MSNDNYLVALKDKIQRIVALNGSKSCQLKILAELETALISMIDQEQQNNVPHQKQSFSKNMADFKKRQKDRQMILSVLDPDSENTSTN